MTTDEMIAHLRGPARQAVNDLIGHYFGTSDKCLASIPANPKRDADLIAATAVVEAADHIEALARRVLELEGALEEIERLYYQEGKDATWRAAHMNGVVRDALKETRDD